MTKAHKAPMKDKRRLYPARYPRMEKGIVKNWAGAIGKNAA
jgi:hypothetical protein